MDQLAKIDELRMRFNISYKAAADLLNETNGDLVEALVRLEQQTKSQSEEMLNKGPEMWEKVKEKVKDNSKKTIVISKDGKTVAQIPTTVGAAGALGALIYTPLTILAGVGTVAALANNYSFKLSDTNENTQFHQDECSSEVIDDAEGNDSKNL